MEHNAVALRDAWPLWRSGMACGLRNLFQRLSPYERVQALRLILCPVDSWRYIEFPAVLEAYRGESPILDIGSPKALALFLAARRSATVHTTDIVPTLGQECRVYQRSAAPGRLKPVAMDGCHLPVGDAAYGFIYSVSVIEHIPGDGDTRTMREIARALKPRGRAVITVPCVPSYKEIWQGSDPFGQQPTDAAGLVFFGRWYDAATLEERVIRPCGLRLLSKVLFQERHAGWYARYCRRTQNPRSVRSVGTKLFDPIHIRRNVERLPDTASQVARHGLAVLVFEKAESS